MIQTVLFATDLGAFNSHLLQHVMSLAQKCDAKIVVVHAVEPLGCLANAVVKSYLTPEIKAEFCNMGLDKLMQIIKDHIIDDLADEYIEGESALSRIIDVSVLVGKPGEVILQEVSRCHADMIIMGSHGPSAVNSNMLGSVTNKVLQLAKVPVYMVPMMAPFTLSSVASHTQISRGINSG